MKVLIVDDEILVRKGLVMSIPWDSLGFLQIFEASNGREALSVAVQEKPDLIVTDIRMPQMDGLELIEHVRSNKIHSIIICLSCLNDSEYIRKAMRFDGAIDYIPKLSMTSEELVEVIRRAFETSDFAAAQNPPIQNAGSMFDFEQRFLITELLQTNDIDATLNELDRMLKLSSKLIFRDCILPEVFALYASVYKDLQQDLYETRVNRQPILSYVENSDLAVIQEVGHVVVKSVFNRYNEQLQKRYGREIALAITYLHQNYRLNISQEDVAQCISLNSSYFSKFFKKQTGQSYINFLNSLRMTKACFYLDESDYSVAKISEQVGFINESYFSRLFKNLTGYSPMAYRKKQIRDETKS
ncbi:response regulator transcription factor [Ruthenibacterium lactatiformans]|uniref:response regulator transcription factor n=1 Tax=Ruthenibacterium lactatiformans TaxID=1550024 RepID=UPI0026DCD946|nr:response regulator [Ruthenibacterium lactatiformans]